MINERGKEETWRAVYAPSKALLGRYHIEGNLDHVFIDNYDITNRLLRGLTARAMMRENPPAWARWCALERVESGRVTFIEIHELTPGGWERRLDWSAYVG